MAGAIVQAASLVWDGFSTVTAQFDNSVQSGNIIVAALCMKTSGFATIRSVTDTLGNDYSIVAPTFNFNSISATAYACKSIASGPNTVTIRLSNPASLPDIRILEISGVDMPPTLSSATGTGTAITDSTAVSSDSMLIAILSDYSGITTFDPAWQIATTSEARNLVAWQEAASGELTFSATGFASADWIVQLLSFPVSLAGIIQPISGFRFQELLSPVLASDPSVMAAAQALDAEFQAVTAAIAQVTIFANLDAQPDVVLDYLGFQLRVYTYSTSYPRATKLALIVNALAFNASIGTLGTLKRILLTIFGDLAIAEWWQYGGAAYHFEVLLFSSASSAVQAAITAAVQALKPVSRAFDGLVVQGSSSETVFVGVGIMETEEYYVGTRPIGFPPIWQRSMGPLKVN
jgi:phage tail P2-like protein